MDLFKTYTELFRSYSEQVSTTRHSAGNRNELMSSLPKSAGVYIIVRKGSPTPIYIGSAGKIRREAARAVRTVKARLSGAYTPYKFATDSHILRYSPVGEVASKPPQSYEHEIPLGEITIIVMATDDALAPAALEYTLIQGFINEFRALPLINQAI